VDDLVAQQLALDEIRSATSSIDDNSRSLTTEIDLAPLVAALQMRVTLSRLVLDWAMAALEGLSTHCWRTCVAAALPTTSTAAPSVYASEAAEAVTHAIRHKPALALAALLERWCLYTNTGRRVGMLPRAVRAKVWVCARMIHLSIQALT